MKKNTTTKTVAAIERAIVYLLGQRTKKGWWTDFDTLAGPSTEWVSAFVAFSLANTKCHVAQVAASETWLRLRRHRWWSTGWGFNSRVPSDADTTVWVLRLGAALGVRLSKRNLRFLSSHVTASGGVTTYARVGPIRAFTRVTGVSFTGWCGAQACVTAAAAGLRQLPHRERVLSWLRTAQNSNGSWTSYWWLSPHYATALACEAIASTPALGDEDRIFRATQWADGDLAQRADVISPFEQAFAVRTLLLNEKTHDAAMRSVDQLMRAQRTDGSWVPSAMLRIPPPNVTEPDAYSAWVEGGRGGGSIQRDLNACFTTATVLQSLAAAADRIGAYDSVDASIRFAYR